jgi:hypothetical protein
MRLNIGKVFIGATLASFAALTLDGCTSAPPEAPPAPSIAADQLVGKWGLASYHNDADRARTETAARGQCNKPYVIAKGQSGGVLMHLADQPKAEEIFVKGSADGKVYLGPAGDPGGQADREIITSNNAEFITRWLDPDAAGRYGTMVYARCPAR